MWNGLLHRMLTEFVRTGTLDLTYPDGTTRRYGIGRPRVGVVLRDASLPRRLVMSPDLAAGEGYMDGTLLVRDDDLSAFMELGYVNSTEENDIWWRRLADSAAAALRLVQQVNPAGRAQRNVAHHYDLSGELFDLFLDRDRQYSCGYFPKGTESLDEAQALKKRHIARKLLIRPGLRVLDIGCGWGGLAITLAQDYGARVTGITLSSEQLEVARRRVAEAGMSDRVEIRLQDYRDVTGRFDRIVSVGMFEHVGLPGYGSYFNQVHDLLTPDGIALVHTIGRSSYPRASSPWILKYIFPGGYVPSLSEVARAIERQGLWLADIEVWRLHYARTLRHWHDRFTANAQAARSLYDERFVRMWRFYLLACEASFVHGTQCVFQFQLSRRVDAVPVTRDYLYTDDDRDVAGLAAQ